jgi:riboflavin synthase
MFSQSFESMINILYIPPLRDLIPAFENRGANIAEIFKKIQLYPTNSEIWPMFTGIIEAMGTITSMEQNGSNSSFWIHSPLGNALKVDQSLSHSGVCLTVEEIQGNMHRVTAIAETLLKTNAGEWIAGTTLNLERCMPLNGRLDGHIVQGHVDTIAQCTGIIEKNGSWEYSFQFPEAFSALVIEKGSISLNGTSLTIFNVGITSFTVAIIPYTYEHTTINIIKKGSTANIEFDLLGKYVQRMLQLKNIT